MPVIIFIFRNFITHPFFRFLHYNVNKNNRKCGEFKRFLKPSDYYQLEKLSPAYQVYFGINEFVSIADNLPEIILTFEKIENFSYFYFK